MLAVLVGGVPVVLVTIVPLHLPSRLPQWADVVQAATRPDDGHLFIAALSVLGLGRVGDLHPQHPAGNPGPDPRAAPGPDPRAERPAARGGGAGRRRRRPGGSTGNDGDRYRAPGPDLDLGRRRRFRLPAPGHAWPWNDASCGGGAPEGESSAAESLPTVAVHRGDSLWGLAERHLGAGSRYHEIAHLNYGRVNRTGDT